MTDRELMQQALDALELLARYENPLTKVQVRKPRDGGQIVTMYPHKVATEAAVPLRARLAQPEQEPWGYISHKSWKMPVFVEAENLEVSGLPFNNPNYTPVYKAPPQREWVGLTDEEKLTIVRETDNPVDALAATEAKLKEKNT